MMKRTFFALLFVGTQLGCRAPGPANSFKVAVVTAKAVGMLSANDVPEEWRLSSDTVIEEKHTTSTFRRGSNTVMKLRWLSDWSENEKRDYLTGVLLDGTIQVASLGGYPPRSIAVSPCVAPTQYEIMVLTSQETNSAVIVTGTNGFSETYILDGRNTAPMDELDYTKMRFFQDFVWKPFAETVTNKVEKTSSQGIHSTK